MSEAAFDSVQLADGRQLSPAQFLALPFGERVRLILERAVEFSLDGKAVDRGIALKGLMVAHQA
jgi:hypothetical protein